MSLLSASIFSVLLEEGMMNAFILKRIAANVDGTFGVLIDGEVPFAVTLEREWLGNQPEVSCIPVGVYTCKRVASPRFGDTFEVTGVPGRSHILFHSGNTEDDSKGCILVAEQFGSINGKTAVQVSREGFAEFLARLNGADEFVVEIKEV